MIPQDERRLNERLLRGIADAANLADPNPHALGTPTIRNALGSVLELSKITDDKFASYSKRISPSDGRFADGMELLNFLIGNGE
jgi:hypothetical protein